MHDACRPCVSVELPHALCEVTTPLCLQTWERELAHHVVENYLKEELELGRGRQAFKLRGVETRCAL